MKWVNRILAVVLLAGVVPLWRQASEFPGTTATFPKVTLAVIALLAVIMLAVSFSRVYTTGLEGVQGSGGALAMLRPLSVLGIALAGVYLTSLVGFFPSMVAVGVGLYSLLGVSRPVLYALSVTLLLVAVYVLFVQVLGVPLPSGRLWQT
jgi:hypothetical protein